MDAAHNKGSNMNGHFGCKLVSGNVAVFTDDGRTATRLDANVYPVGSSFSARYEHPEGIILLPGDAARLGLDVDDLHDRDRPGEET